MMEDLKEKIYKFLKENKGKKFNQKQISQKTKISYPAVLKWIAVLIAESRDPKVKVDDYGSIKLVYV